jgi:hypothetical protein
LVGLREVANRALAQNLRSVALGEQALQDSLEQTHVKSFGVTQAKKILITFHIWRALNPMRLRWLAHLEIDVPYSAFNCLPLAARLGNSFCSSPRANASGKQLGLLVGSQAVRGAFLAVSRSKPTPQSLTVVLWECAPVFESRICVRSGSWGINR